MTPSAAMASHDSKRMMDMSLKTILVMLDHRGLAFNHARCAANLCSRHRAQLIGVHVVPTWSGIPAYSFAVGHIAIGSVIDSQIAQEDGCRDEAARAFNEIAGHYGVAAEFRVFRQGETNTMLPIHSLYVDLAIAGLTDQARRAGSDRILETIVTSSGTPAILIPEHWANDLIGDRILIVWDKSREARRAVVDALPLLAAATSVSLMVIDHPGRSAGTSDPPVDFAELLSRQGVAATVIKMTASNESITRRLMDIATSNDIDLIVLGAYGHSKMHDLIYGDVSRSILKTATVPLFVAH